MFQSFSALCIIWFFIPYQGASLKWVRFFMFLDLFNYSAGAVDLRDFMNYSKDSPVPQSYHTQD